MIAGEDSYACKSTEDTSFCKFALIERGLSLTDKSKHRFGEQFMNHADPEITIQHAAFYAENSYLWLETL